VVLVHPLRHHALLEHVSALAMAVALFATGLRLRRPWSLAGWQAPIRLLGLAMPLTIGLVAVWGVALMGLPLGVAVVLGAALAPTDPVLAGNLGVRPVRQRPREEAQEARFALSTEATLNDGLGLPFLLLGLYLVADRDDWVAGWLGGHVVWAIGGGVLVGVAAGRGLAWALGAASRRGWTAPETRAFVGVAVPLVVFGLADALACSGFLAALAAGRAFGGQRRSVDAEPERVARAPETAKDLAELAVIVLLGMLLAQADLGAPGLGGWLLVPALFLVVRPLTVLLAVVRAPLSLRERAYVAWFGVKGVASLN
jgi:NhaP-type Na+/H+ or K+/H+ antiporter